MLQPSSQWDLRIWFEMGRVFWCCVAVVATAQLKISPALLLGALPVVPEKPRWGAFVLASFAFLGLKWAVAPDWFAQFAARSAILDERGPDNPSLFAFIRADVHLRIFMAAVTYALIAPRFMDYSYELLLPVGLWFFRQPRFLLPIAVALAIPQARGPRVATAIGRALLTYYPLFCALLLFGLLLAELRPAPVSDTR